MLFFAKKLLTKPFIFYIIETMSGSRGISCLREHRLDMSIFARYAKVPEFKIRGGAGQ